MTPPGVPEVAASEELFCGPVTWDDDPAFVCVVGVGEGASVTDSLLPGETKPGVTVVVMFASVLEIFVVVGTVAAVTELDVEPGAVEEVGVAVVVVVVSVVALLERVVLDVEPGAAEEVVVGVAVVVVVSVVTLLVTVLLERVAFCPMAEATKGRMRRARRKKAFILDVLAGQSKEEMTSLQPSSALTLLWVQSPVIN